VNGFPTAVDVLAVGRDALPRVRTDDPPPLRSFGADDQQVVPTIAGPDRVRGWLGRGRDALPRVRADDRQVVPTTKKASATA